MLGLSGPAAADTTFTPSEPGATASDPRVVRDASVVVGIDQGARSYQRSTSSGTFTARTGTQVSNGALAVSLGFGVLNTACLGTLTPKDVVTVTGPGADTTVVGSPTTSPIRDLADTTPLKYEPKNPAPADSTITYRGDVTDTDAYHGVQATVDLTGKPAGTYTVTTTTYNMLKTGLSACVVGTPTGTGNTFATGPVTTTKTFEYRPWKVTFTDVLSQGRVSANYNPAEFTFSLGATSAPIYAGTGATQQFYTLGGTYLLPSDPEACVTDSASCLPSNAVPCNPAAGCVPRIMLINQPGTTSLYGVFDLETKAFVAAAQIEGVQRYLVSLGAENDAYYRQVLQQLSAGSAEGGVDLASLLATEVISRNGREETSLSLLNGLQIDPSTKRGGVHLNSTSTVQAGVLLDIYAALGSSSCTSQTGGSGLPEDRFTPTAGHGYTVTRTDFLPEVPAAGPLAALTSGPVYHIQGKFNDGALVNTASALIGVDTATDEPNGYPVWVEPFISAPTHVAKPKTMDFVGTATWQASETSLGATGCLVVDFLAGTGVAVFNNPLAVGLGTLIDSIGQPNPEMRKLYTAVDEAVGPAVDSATSLPVVDEVLTTVLDALALPGL